MAKKDYSRLVKKHVITKQGRRTSVWVKRSGSTPFKYVVTNKGKKHGFNKMERVKAWAKSAGMKEVKVQKVTGDKPQVVNLEFNDKTETFTEKE